jgi:hypothetical protein
VNVHSEIRANKHGFQTSESLYSQTGRYSVSKHSMTITRWYYDRHGKEFEEFKIEQHMGKLLITKGDEKLNNKKVLMEFKHPTEPLILTK